MDLLEKVHYTCLCIMCHRPVENPLCVECTEEADQLAKEALEREGQRKQKAVPANQRKVF